MTRRSLLFALLALTGSAYATSWTTPKGAAVDDDPFWACAMASKGAWRSEKEHRALYFCVAEAYDRRATARGADEFSSDECRAQCAREEAALGPNVIYDCWCLEDSPPSRSWPFVALHADRDQFYCHTSERPCMHAAFYLKRGPAYRGEHQPVIFSVDNVLGSDGRRFAKGDRSACPTDGLPLAIDPVAQTTAPEINRIVIVERATGKRWEAGKPLPERGR